MVSEDATTKLKGLVDSISQEQADRTDTDSDDSRATAKWKRLLESLMGEGFGIEDISDGDYQIKLEVDVQSGHQVAAFTPMHGFTPPDDPTVRKVVSAIAGIFDKMSDDQAEKIKRAAASGDQAAILEAFRSGRDSGAFGVRPTRAFLDSVFSVDPETFSASDRRLLRECRLVTAHLLARWELAGAEANALLREESDRLDDGQKSDLVMITASAEMQRGHPETALHIWRKLLEKPEVLGPGNRGWAWRNIALASAPDSVASCHAAKCSADAFLEAGDKQEAAKSLMQLANLLLTEKPDQAIKTIDEILDLIDREGLQNQELRAATHHARANRLAQLGKHPDAFVDAKAAAELWRELIGAEDQLISSLHLAALEAEKVGDNPTASALKEEANGLTKRVQSEHFLLAQRIDELVQAYDPDQAIEMLAEAERQRNQSAIIAIRVIQATRDPTKNDTERLSLLEEALSKIESGPGWRSLKEVVQLALAGELSRSGASEPSEKWFRRVLDANPFQTQARDALIQSLWRRGQWGDAAIVIKKQIDLQGEMLGLCYAYGRSLFESGNYSRAISAFTRAINLGGKDTNFVKHATEFREQALQRGGTLEPEIAEEKQGRTVTREEFERSIDLFAHFVSAYKRMEFWTTKDSKKSWTPSPEKLAQNVLHTFLKGRFLERINIFEELGSGAGRLDIYVQLQGGLNIILELKMCGGGYSSNYAASGETQLIHYMENRESKLGYLVVFDARSRDFGKVLLNGGNSLTILTRIVDLRPTVGT